MTFVNLYRPHSLPFVTTHHRKIVGKLSESSERASLISKIASLSSKLKHMQRQHDNLESTKADLQTLLKVVGQESLHDEKSIAEQNRKIQEQAQYLQRQIGQSSRSKHLYNCSQYWQLFVK